MAERGFEQSFLDVVHCVFRGEQMYPVLLSPGTDVSPKRIASLSLYAWKTHQGLDCVIKSQYNQPRQHPRITSSRRPILIVKFRDTKNVTLALLYFHRNRTMDRQFKRATSAAPRGETSVQDLSKGVINRLEACQTQNLDRSDISAGSNRLPLLLLKLKLQELGFRLHQYGAHIRNREDLRMNNIQPHVLEIVNAILMGNINPVHIQPQTNLMRQSGQLKTHVSDGIPTVLAICRVCYQDTEEKQLVRLECGHSFCKECFRGHIKNNIQEARYKIDCMQIECGYTLQDQLIQQMIEEVDYNRYKYFKRKKELQRNPNNNFCQKPNCQGILEQKDDIHTCPECKTDYCSSCLRIRHDGDCSTQIQQIIERAYKDYNIKKCPSCKAPIQKVDGCNHMSCRHCTFEFCWLCLGKYTKYHYRYFNCCGCPGMQFQNEEEMHCERAKQILIYLVMPPIVALVLLALLGLLPLYMLVMLIIKPFQKAMQIECLKGLQCCNCDCDCRDQCEDCDCCGQCCFQEDVNLCQVLVGFLLIPYGVLYAIFVVPIKFCYIVYSNIAQIME